MGLFSDTVPMFGYHKRSYIVLACLVGGITLSILGLLPFSGEWAPFAALLLIPVHLQIAIVDLLTEGKYAELMVHHPETGSDLVSYVWLVNTVGTFIASLAAGPIADFFQPRFAFLLAVPIAVHTVLPVVAGWFPEERLPPSQRGVRMDKLNAYPNLLKLSVSLTIGACIITASAFSSAYFQSMVSVVIAVIMAVLGLLWLPDPLRRANLYLFLNNAFYISLSGALDYFFTADETCVPGGPQFSMTYYITYANVVASFAAIGGIVFFQKYLSHSKFQFAFLFAGFVRIAASLFDYVIVKRYNLLIGLSDRAFFLIGDATIYQAVLMLELMPAVVLTSKVCPPGMEASIYALLASYQNLGQYIAGAVGVALIDWCGIQTTAPCNFEGLPMALIIAHIGMPLLSFPLVFWLIPDIRMTDDVIGTFHAEWMTENTHAPLLTAPHIESEGISHQM